MKNLRLVASSLIVVALLSIGCHSNKAKKIKEGPDQVISVAQLFEKGQAELAKGHQVNARRYFDQIALREDAGEYKDKATVAIADTYYSEHTVDAYTEAISRYQSFIAFHPTHPQAPYCQYRIALAYFEEMLTPDRDQQAARSAKTALESVVENYPNSPEAGEAKKKIKEVYDTLAAHEIKVGDYYLNNGYPKSAAERYRGVLKNYPDYWNLFLLYSRLGEALYRSGNYEEAAVYFNRIIKESPESKLAQTAQKRLDAIHKGSVSKSRKGKVEDLPKEPIIKPKKDKHWWQFWKKSSKGAQKTQPGS